LCGELCGQNCVVFTTINQDFGGSFQLPTSAKHVVIKSLSTAQTTKLYSAWQ